MRDVEVLQSYREGMRELRILEKQMESWTNAGGPQGCSRAALTGMPRGTNHPQAAMEQHADGLMALWEKQRETLLDIGMRFEKILMEVKSPRLRLVLRCYYGLGMTDELIAQDMNMSIRRVNSLRNSFVRSLDQQEAA